MASRVVTCRSIVVCLLFEVEGMLLKPCHIFLWTKYLLRSFRRIMVKYRNTIVVCLDVRLSIARTDQQGHHQRLEVQRVFYFRDKLTEFINTGGHLPKLEDRQIMIIGVTY
jgi:hypothetical protein